MKATIEGKSGISVDVTLEDDEIMIVDLDSLWLRPMDQNKASMYGTEEGLRHLVTMISEELQQKYPEEEFEIKWR